MKKNKSYIYFSTLSILLCSLMFFACLVKDTETTSSDKSGTTFDISETTTTVISTIYSQESGDSWHRVGQDNYVNTYRGAYWVGPSMSLNKAVFHLNKVGNPDNINYCVSVWEIDVTDHLRLKTLLGQSSIVSGTLISEGGSWINFDFPIPVLVTSGNTVILISRADKENADINNHITINNNYDTTDKENYQFNVHYSGLSLAGRSVGDEDQPEPFAVNIRLIGSWAQEALINEFPAPPMRLVRTNLSSSDVNLNWINNNIAVTVSSYNIYDYNTTTGVLTLILATTNTNATLTGLVNSANRAFVVTAVSNIGKESYFSDVARTSNPVR